MPDFGLIIIGVGVVCVIAYIVNRRIKKGKLNFPK